MNKKDEKRLLDEISTKGYQQYLSVKELISTNYIKRRNWNWDHIERIHSALNTMSSHILRYICLVLLSDKYQESSLEDIRDKLFDEAILDIHTWHHIKLVQSPISNTTGDIRIAGHLLYYASIDIILCYFFECRANKHMSKVNFWSWCTKSKDISFVRKMVSKTKKYELNYGAKEHSYKWIANETNIFNKG